MSVALNPDLVLIRTKAGSLDNVKTLNVCGNNLGDLSLLREMPNIEVLSLSVNQISTLRCLQFCSKLKQVYLRDNQIASLAELKYLQASPELSVCPPISTFILGLAFKPFTNATRSLFLRSLIFDEYGSNFKVRINNFSPDG